MSMGFLLDPNQAVIYRGPMLHGVVQQFFREVAWDEVDYLIVDLPPVVTPRQQHPWRLRQPASGQCPL